MKQIKISIPATTANLGPGFDCLGLALELFNHVMFTAVSEILIPFTHPEPTELHITVDGIDAHKVTTTHRNLVVESANVLFERLGKRPSCLHIHQTNNIPVGSGLGSSSTAVLAGILGANALLDNPLSRAELLEIAYEIEGHPDNVAPALYGGLVLGTQTGPVLHIEKLPIAPMQAAVVLPDFHLLTTEARAALPKTVSRADAIYNAGHLGLLIRALETADYHKLAIAMQDKIHHQYRIPLIPGMASAFAAAKEAGAKGVALSGAGPSVIAFAPDGHEKIVEVITAVFANAGLTSRSWILPIDKTGSTIQIDTKNE
ncbi:MAG: homoserine kinase [Chloroflexi bacterium]|nr:MAG: homoserine kinase [Chloroflexota bacterium]